MRNDLLGAIHDCKTPPAKQPCLLGLLLSQGACGVPETQLGEWPGYCLPEYTVQFCWFSRVNTHSFACFDDQNERERNSVVASLLSSQIKPIWNRLFPSLFWVTRRVLNRILYPNIMEQRKYFSALVYIVVDSLCFSVAFWHNHPARTWYLI